MFGSVKRPRMKHNARLARRETRRSHSTCHNPKQLNQDQWSDSGVTPASLRSEAGPTDISRRASFTPALLLK